MTPHSNFVSLTDGRPLMLAASILPASSDHSSLAASSRAIEGVSVFASSTSVNVGKSPLFGVVSRRFKSMGRVLLRPLQTRG